MKIWLVSQVIAPGVHVTALRLVQFAGVLGVTEPVTALPRMPAGFESPVPSAAARLLLAAGDSHMHPVASRTCAGGRHAL
jgi:hypothetical protein